MDKSWSIKAYTTDLDLKGWDLVDQYLFGNKEASHSFLGLFNAEGELVSRIDGKCYDAEKQKIAPCNADLTTCFNIAAHSLGLSAIFDSVARFFGFKKKLPQLKAVITDGQTWPLEEEAQEIASFEGDQQTVMAHWLQCCKRTEDINGRGNLAYVPLDTSMEGQNCNSVLALMLKTIGINLNKEKAIHALPGFGYDMSPSLDNNKSYSYRFAITEQQKILDGFHGRSAGQFFGAPETWASETPDAKENVTRTENTRGIGELAYV